MSCSPSWRTPAAAGSSPRTRPPRCGGWLCKYFLLHLQIFSRQLARDKSELSAQLQENEEELAEVIRKYKSSVSTISQDQLTIQNQAQHVQVSRQYSEAINRISR